MTPRLILAIVSTILEETAIVVIVRWALPQVGIDIHVAGLVAIMVAWVAYSVTVYRIGSRALRRKPVINLPDMVGSMGRAASPLMPDGLIKIKGELWVAKSAAGEIQSGEEVVVLAQKRLKLTVQAAKSASNPEKTESVSG